jgi:AraC-like DNA-binding protein
MTRNHYLLHELGSQLRKRPQGAGRHDLVLIVGQEGEQYGEPLASMLPQCRVIVTPGPEAANRLFLSSPADLVILNHSRRLPCFDLLSAFKSLRPSVPVMVVTDCGTEELAVQAFRHGAIDYFKKPFALDELELSIRAILEIRTKFQGQDNPLPVSGLQRALQYLGTNYQKPIRLTEAAREAGMSNSCFERYLKNQTGHTFTAYLNYLRIARARELLQAGSASALQVALACGFNNQSHFNRVFRKLTGTTPGAFRKEAGPSRLESPPNLPF